MNPVTAIGLPAIMYQERFQNHPNKQPENQDEQQKISMKDLNGLAKQMESIFITTIMKSMRKTIMKSGLFHGGQAEETFTQMLDDEIANLASSREKGFGIAKAIVKKYSKFADATKVEKTK